MSRLRNSRISAAAGIIGALGALNACGNEESGRGDAQKTGTERECVPFTVYAQNRYPAPGTTEADPDEQRFGAAIRSTPLYFADDPGKNYVNGIEGNTPLLVDGWTDPDRLVYPDNHRPWNSTVWYRVINQQIDSTQLSIPDNDVIGGWASFAGVRGGPTQPYYIDGRLRDGGKPAPLPPECEISTQWSQQQ